MWCSYNSILTKRFSNIFYSHTQTTLLYNIFHIGTLLLLCVSHNSHRLDTPILARPQRITRGIALIRLLTVPHLNRI